MAYLIDTNVLLRFLQRSDADHGSVRRAIRRLAERGERGCYAPQNLVEFWRTCTRPTTANGFGLSIAATNRRARTIERLFLLLPDRPEVHIDWRQLVVVHAVSGVQVHDARLVAVMRVYGLANILTLNTAHFSRYPGITALHPRDV